MYKNLIPKLKNILSRDADVLFAYLFGSLAEDREYSESDIDIAVYLKSGAMEYFLKKDKQILGELALCLHRDDVDLHILNVTPLLLQFEIISQGKIIFCRDEQARVDFETDVLYRYFDMKPFFDEQRELTMQAIKEGY
ncbi:MAG: nucleotidyltransferase domain-containing protein [Candidatus Omnitrophica bacterium]|nr:nucleotidyltransferase domain-containing protein [Candidatus Omnitrophota bacterium]